MPVGAPKEAAPTPVRTEPRLPARPPESQLQFDLEAANVAQKGLDNSSDRRSALEIIAGKKTAEVAVRQILGKKEALGKKGSDKKAERELGKAAAKLEAEKAELGVVIETLKTSDETSQRALGYDLEIGLRQQALGRLDKKTQTQEVEEIQNEIVRLREERGKIATEDGDVMPNQIEEIIKNGIDESVIDSMRTAIAENPLNVLESILVNEGLAAVGQSEGFSFFENLQKNLGYSQEDADQLEAALGSEVSSIPTDTELGKKLKKNETFKKAGLLGLLLAAYITYSAGKRASKDSQQGQGGTM